jgi:hypothetical protein
MQWLENAVRRLGLDRLLEPWMERMSLRTLLRMMDVLAVVWSLLVGALPALLVLALLDPADRTVDYQLAAGVWLLSSVAVFFWFSRHFNLLPLHRLEKEPYEE